MGRRMVSFGTWAFRRDIGRGLRHGFGVGGVAAHGPARQVTDAVEREGRLVDLRVEFLVRHPRDGPRVDPPTAPTRRDLSIMSVSNPKCVASFASASFLFQNFTRYTTSTCPVGPLRRMTSNAAIALRVAGSMS